MKQVVQSYKNGNVKLKNVPVPRCGSKSILIKNQTSLISIGTERSIIDLGRKSLAMKAAARPDLVRRVWDKAKKEGLLKTYKEVLGRLDTPTPLGYSSAGIIEECGIAATEFSPGDRVSCIGQGFASHAEFVTVPVNLVCKIPEGVSNEEASFGMLGCIALHGIRCAKLSFGSRVVVIGLGLIGLLTVQILKAYGCEIIAQDHDEYKSKTAKELGVIDSTVQISELERLSDERSKGHGVDAVIITANTKKSDPVDLAIKLCRSRGKIVIVGVTDIHPDRNELWQKEIELLVSKAAGPGSLDPLYELEGVDLPIGDVRWTQKRNLEEFLRLLRIKKVNVLSLVTHRYPIAEAESAYKQIIGNELHNPIAILLNYFENTPINRSFPTPQFHKSKYSNKDNVKLGVIGAGLFGKALLLPALKKLPGICLHTLVTSSGTNVEHISSKFGFLNQSTDTEKIWSNKEIDGVIGLTPHSNHAKLVHNALEKNKPLFLEKPLCTSLKELKEIKEKVENLERLPILMIGHNRRFSSHTKKIQSWLKSRVSPLVLQMRVNSGHVPHTHWVNSEPEGRSRIVGEISHFIDLFQSLIGNNVIRLHAERISGNNKSVVNNDNLVVALKFKDGSIANLTYSALGDKAYSRESIEIFFDSKIISLHDFRRSELHENGKTIVYKTSSQEMGYSEELDHFKNCLSGKENQIVSMEEIFATMKTIFAIENSLATANAVNI